MKIQTINKVSYIFSSSITEINLFFALEGWWIFCLIKELCEFFWNYSNHFKYIYFANNKSKLPQSYVCSCILHFQKLSSSSTQKIIYMYMVILQYKPDKPNWKQKTGGSLLTHLHMKPSDDK